MSQKGGKSTIRVWVIRIIVIALLLAAVIKSPTAFVAALVGIILAGYLIFLWLKWKFWRILSPLSEWGDAISQVTLSLQKSTRPFYHPERANAAIEALKQNGFMILGTYTAKQVSRTNVVLANHENNDVHALIMDTEFLGVTTEFCSRYEDGGSFTCSNTELPGIMPRPDNHPITRLPKAEVQTVLDEFKASRPPSGICKIADKDIQSQVETLYNELKCYEIETLEKTADTDAQLLENFIISSGWSAIEWHRKQPDVVIIHDKLKDYDLISKFEEAIDDEDEQYKKLKGRAESVIRNNPPLEAFRILSSEIPTKIRLKKILELTDPIPAHVYLKDKPKE